MPEFKINQNNLAFIISIFTVIGLIVTGTIWVTDRVAMKSDIEKLNADLSKQIKLKHIDVMIQLTETALIAYESRVANGFELTPAEQRKYEQMQKLHEKQQADYREITDG